MELFPDPSGPPLDSYEEEGKSDLKLRTAFKQKKPTQIAGFTPLL